MTDKIDLNDDIYEMYTGETEAQASQHFLETFGRQPDRVISGYGALFLGPVTQAEDAARKARPTQAQPAARSSIPGYQQLSFMDQDGQP